MGDELIQEDWERVHLMDEMYKKELEWEEYQFLEERQKRLPAIIKVMIPEFKKETNEIR